MESESASALAMASQRDGCEECIQPPVSGRWNLQIEWTTCASFSRLYGSSSVTLPGVICFALGFFDFRWVSKKSSDAHCGVIAWAMIRSLCRSFETVALHAILPFWDSWALFVCPFRNILQSPSQQEVVIDAPSGCCGDMVKSRGAMISPSGALIISQTHQRDSTG